MSQKILQHISLTDELINISRIISNSGVSSYIVGGFIRDSLIGIKTVDIDIAVSNKVSEIGTLLAKKTNGKCITLDKKRNIYRVITGTLYSNIQIDIVEAATGIKNDLMNRDFTINSMAINMSDVAKMSKTTIGIKDIIDPYNGIKDLESNKLQLTSPNSLREDPVRLIRAIRISSQLNLEISSTLKDAIFEQSHLINKPARERIRAEFLNILKQKNSSKWLREMDSLGLLTQIIPEIEHTKGVSQPKEHYWDVFNHLIESVNKIEEIFEYCLSKNPQNTTIGTQFMSQIPTHPTIDCHFNSIAGNGHTRVTASKLACLLHDISKPETKTIEETGRIRFLKHAEKGAKISEIILKNLKCSNSLINIVSSQILYHLRPGQISQKSEMPSEKAIKKYYRDLGTVAIDTLYLNMADYLAAKGPLLEQSDWEKYCLVINDILKNGLNKNIPDKIPNLISGQDIMNRLNLDPGPLIGNILTKVQDAQEDGIIKNKEEALKYIEKFTSLGE